MRSMGGWLAWAVVLAACAGPGGVVRPSTRPLGGGRPLLAAWGSAATLGDEEPEGPALGEVTARQQESECRLAAAHQWRILAPIDAMGAEVEIIYWANQGALTMLSWRRLAAGAGQGEAIDERVFTENLQRPLLAYIGGASRQLRLIQRRESGRWVLKSLESSYDGLSMPPPEAKALPVDAPDIAAGSFAMLEREARTRWLPLLKAPVDGSARLELRVELEDERLVGSSPVRYQTNGHGVSIGLPPLFELQVAGALAPFTQGLGRRAVRLMLVAERTGNEAAPRWRIESASTERPKAVDRAEPFTTRTDYRLLHEEIVRRWREEVHGAAVVAASFTAEQMALWILGGWAARGVGRALELTVGPLARILGNRGPEVVGWLAGLVRRVPEGERQALARLWAKIEVQGIEALAAAERAELRAVLLRLERLAATPLTAAEKDALRGIARKQFWRHLRQIDPALPGKLANLDGTPYNVHHRIPLEYAHLALEKDINALPNLVAAGKEIHASVGRVWTAFRTRKAQPSFADVQRLATIIDRHYARWFNAPYDALLHEASLATAERTALVELGMLVY